MLKSVLITTWDAKIAVAIDADNIKFIIANFLYTTAFREIA